MLEKDVLFDLANETVRNYGDIEPNFAQNMVRRIQRKFSVKVMPEEITEYALHYKEIYRFAKSVFRNYLKLPKRKYADPSDIDFENFCFALRENILMMMISFCKRFAIG